MCTKHNVRRNMINIRCMCIKLVFLIFRFFKTEGNEDAFLVFFLNICTIWPQIRSSKGSLSNFKVTKGGCSCSTLRISHYEEEFREKMVLYCNFPFNMTQFTLFCNHFRLITIHTRALTV